MIPHVISFFGRTINWTMWWSNVLMKQQEKFIPLGFFWSVPTRLPCRKVPYERLHFCYEIKVKNWELHLNIKTNSPAKRFVSLLARQETNYPFGIQENKEAETKCKWKENEDSKSKMMNYASSAVKWYYSYSSNKKYSYRTQSDEIYFFHIISLIIFVYWIPINAVVGIQ